MAKKEKKEEAPRGTPAWMLTYGDMMTLLLTFFVLIVSFSTIQDANFKQAIGSLQGALGILGQQEYMVSLGKIIVPEATYAFMSRRSRQTTGEISNKLNFVTAEQGTEIYEDDRGLNIVLPASILFDSGSDVLKQDAYPLIKKIGAFLFELKNPIMIEGHTDNTPIKTFRFPSNWYLSSARAISLVNFFNEYCGLDPRRFSVCGYAEYKPIAPNDTEENRKKNRRVVMIVESEQWTRSKQQRAES